MIDAERTARNLLEAGELALPLPGQGNTAERHLRLYELARSHSLSVARIVEAHTDAVAILCEAGRDPVPGALYGVWASSGPGTGATLSATAQTLDGAKAFCSGAGLVDRALVTTSQAEGERRLVDVDASRSATLAFDTAGWQAAGLVDTRTGTARFSAHPVDAPVVGDTDSWYLDRPGFWFGAIGPAACWAGGAAGLVDAAEAMTDDDPHRRADLGAMRAARWAMEATLSAAGDQIDRIAPSHSTDGCRLALSVRHTVERLATEVLDRFGQALGPRPFVSDAQLGQRWSDTHLFMRQDHGSRDLEVLGARP